MTVANEIPEPTNVHEAINMVMGRVGYVQKQDTKGLPYTFAGEAAFIKAVRPHLVDVGLVVYQSDVELLGRYEFTSNKGAQGINILAKFTWMWVHAVSGTYFEVTTIGEAADYGDKAANKAMTAAMKYNMRQTLVIETGDDPDNTPSTDFERTATEKKPATIEQRPYHPHFTKERTDAKVAHYTKEDKPSNEKQFGLAMGCLGLCFAGDKQSDGKRRSVLAFLFGVDSGKELSSPQVLALLDWLEPTKDTGDAYAPSAFAEMEAKKIVAARVKELGQEAMFPGEPE
jgi:hypothetical protein